MHHKKLYGVATVGTKGQVVIPSDAREELGIQTGDRLYVVGSHEHKWVGFLKEEQLRQLVERITDDIENYKSVLNSKEQIDD
jgi:AbrB family looped-hinge helix DNA binding protein